MPVPFLLSTDAIDQATGIEARFFHGDISSGTGPFLPALMDSTNQSQGTNRSGVSGSYGQVFEGAGALYVVLYSNNTDQKVRVFSSTDSGATWNAVDNSNSPAIEGAAAYYWDRVNTIYVVYRPAGGTAIQFQNFVLASGGGGSWGAAYGNVAGAPAGPVCQFLYRRPNGTLFVLLRSNTFNQFSPTTSTVIAASYDPVGNAWNPEFDPGTGFSSLPGYPAAFLLVQFVSHYMDCAGNIGAFFGIGSFDGSWGSRIFYQQIKINDSLGAFADLGQPTTFTPNFGACLVLKEADKLVLWIAHDNPATGASPYPTVYVGAPISNPTWTANTAGIDDKTDVTLQVWSPGGGAFDGTTMMFVWAVTDATGSTSAARLRRAVSTNLADPTLGWTTDTSYDFVADGPPGFTTGFQFLALPSISGVLLCPASARVSNRLRLPGTIGLYANG